MVSAGGEASSRSRLGIPSSKAVLEGTSLDIKKEIHDISNQPEPRQPLCTDLTSVVTRNHSSQCS